jgi:5-formyltetrahydrofolate cyclo-ligase
MHDDPDHSRPQHASLPGIPGQPGPATAADADAMAWPEVARWRKAERERLIAARLAIPADARATMSSAIAAQLDAIVGDVSNRTISLYWPFRGEPDLRPWMASLVARGGMPALPVVIEKARPLVFRPYRPGDRLEKGVWNIPIPAEGDPVIPDIVIAPLVGVDPKNYRLGYGGGFFDRTLAALPPATIAVGVGYEMAEMPTIRPHGFDIPMRHIVTENGIRSHGGKRDREPPFDAGPISP